MQVIEGVLISAPIPNVVLEHKEIKVIMATDRNYTILSVVQNVHIRSITRLCHQSQHSKILKNQNQPYENKTPNPNKERRESQMNHKVSIT